MRLVTYAETGTSDLRVGRLEGDRVFPLRYRGPQGMLDLIRAGADADTSAAGPEVQVQSVRLHAPIPVPHTNLICLGRNYSEHAREMAGNGGDTQVQPTFFAKGVNTVIGPYDEIPDNTSLTRQLDWEVELGVVLGDTVRNVSEGEALRHVFGYVVLNDLSARDLQYGFGGQFYYGKNLDGTCPMGPCLVTADEIGDPQTLTLSLMVNGVQKQQARTADMIFGVGRTIEILGRAMTLLPGQIIATGTPAGVGNGRNPKEFLQPGDEVVSEVDRIGAMRNRVAGPKA